MARGGRREGAGRKPGTVSKAKQSLQNAAREKAESALGVLASVMSDEQAPHAARVSAANSILDRGYGKPMQQVDNTSTDGSMTPKEPVAIYQLPANGRDGAT